MIAKPEPDAGRGGTILFVDDEPLSLKYFKASVGKYANVVTADSTDAALKILASEGDTISVVVSDERMPRDSGVSFLSSVRKSWPSTVRILTSAYADIDLQQAINGAAIHRFLPKPWDIDELCAAMQEALQAERAAEDPSDPTQDGPRDAENANLELLAILARELTKPLDSLDSEAIKLSALMGAQPITTGHKQSQIASWSTRMRAVQIATAAHQIHSNIEYCKSLTAPIAVLAEGLRGATGLQTFSMAETASEVLEKIARGHANRKFIALDARRDFQYRAPKPIMAFVLSNMLQSTIRQLADVRSDISIELVPGHDGNEVRITAQLDGVDGQLREFERINRSALWAFGGELLQSSDTDTGTWTTAVRLPNAEDPAGASSH
jgi:two-component system probable response regulator PhcQ